MRRYLAVLGADSCLSSSFDDSWLDRRPLAASEKPLGLYSFLEVLRLRTRSAPTPEGVVLLGLPTPLDLCGIRSLSPFVVLLFELGRHGISRKRENTDDRVQYCTLITTGMVRKRALAPVGGLPRPSTYIHTYTITSSVEESLGMVVGSRKRERAC